jgi:hypothetical protein
MRSVLFVTLITSVSIVASCALAKPTRSECIAGFHIDWSDVRSDHVAATNQLDIPERPQLIPNLAGIAFSSDLSKMYVQFMRNCEQKYSLSDQLIRVWRNQKKILPHFERMREPVVPSPQTIDLQGSYWKD